MAPAWLVWAGPLLLALVATCPPAWTARRPGALADIGASVAVLGLIGAAAAFAWSPDARGAAFAYVDALSLAVLVLVALVGAVVLRFSKAYLDGDPRQGPFLRTLALTLAAVLTMVASGHLALTGLAWLATGIGLRRLLTFYANRPAAVLCARKNLIVSRTADLALLAAAVLLHGAAGGLDYPTLFARAAEWRAAGPPTSVPEAMGLIVLAALLKSAQIPTHGWLLEVMETPTPVSALLHAGLINGGGFLLLRLAPLLEQAPGALAVLAVVGAATAIFGSLVMLTQTSVKVSLAYSTVAQIGFMMLEIGLGAYAAALLHLVAHSLYKAHAFLSSGSAVELARAAWSPTPGDRPHRARLLMAMAAAAGLSLTAGAAFGADLIHTPGVVVLGAVLMLGLTQLLAQALDARLSGFVAFRALGLAALVACVYFGLQAATERLMTGVLPVHVDVAASWRVCLAAIVIAAFAGLTAFQITVVGRVDGPRWRALYAHIANGFYLNTLINGWLLRSGGSARRSTSLLGARP